MSRACYGIGAVYLMAWLVAFPGYLPLGSVHFVVGGLAVAVSLAYAAPCATSWRFLPLVSLLAGVSCLWPEKSVVSLAFLTAIVFATELLWQKLPMLTLVALAGMSATIQYLAGVFSFPLRLSLTQFAVGALGLTGAPAAAAGNSILFNGHEYAVDPACMGVKMLITSLLCSVFITAVLQRRNGRYLQPMALLASLAMVFVLNLFSNVVRILVLVYFHILPGSPLHDAVGLLCLALYVLLPAMWLTGRLITRYGVPPPKQMLQRVLPLTHLQRLVVMGGLAILLLGAWVRLRVASTSQHFLLPPVNGYKAAMYGSDVLQYSNNDVLVYVKPINSVLEGEHNPVMCWQGLGYTFEKINEIQVAHAHIYTGVIKKGGATLHTAWWYDNGTHQTTSFFAWRKNVLQGAPKYAIMNVTTTEEHQLYITVTAAINQRLFAPAIRSKW